MRLFSFFGRAGLVEWWVTHGVSLVAYLFSFPLISKTFTGRYGMGGEPFMTWDELGLVGQICICVSFALFIWINIAVGVRRLHDWGWSGWWFLMQLIPLFGLYWSVGNAIRPGVIGPNRFGPDPLAPRIVWPQ